MTFASGTPPGCIVSMGSLAGGVAGARPPANGWQASGLLGNSETFRTSGARAAEGSRNAGPTISRSFHLVSRTIHSHIHERSHEPRAVRQVS